MKLRFHNPFDLVVPEARLEPAQVAPHAPETLYNFIFNI